MNYTTEEKVCILFGEIGLAASKFYSLLEFFDGSAAKLYKEFPSSSECEKVCKEHYKRICQGIKENETDKIIQKMDELGDFAVTCFSENFPETLRNIPDPPYALFCKGNGDLLNSRCLGVVGTRKVSVYGRNVAKDFTSVLSEYFTIVSGLAYGVDSLAHETTLDEGGKTIAVFGGGLEVIYPASNRGLAERIVKSGGLLVSEYGLFAQPRPYHFPHRNRIVSGLSDGVLVCQAPLKSGTSGTVECALNQGKDVFAVPGEIYDAGFMGNNRLIKSLQGVCVITPRDIVDFYELESVQTEKTQSYQLSFDEQKIVDALSLGQLSFDKLVEKTGISPADLNFLLANLEIKSIIARLPGNMYRSYGGNR